ncbi:MAG: hypothetical protein H6559_21305 [Lewinellaceae bacterium]|nr:hypothetical protein [Lewinellaceae bacterium]
MNLKTISLLLFSAFLNLTVTAQEIRIPQERVAVKIKEYIEKNYPTATRIKYYQEVINDTVFMESEFKFRGNKYAVTFYDEALYEVEIFLAFKDIPTPAQKAIKSTLDSLFTRHKILVCQEVNPRTDLLYEIRVEGTSERSTAFWELYFTPSGKLVKKTEFIVRPIPSHF